MKKFALMICLLAGSVLAHAQFEKGRYIINPSISGLQLSYSKAEKAKFQLDLKGGRFLVNNLAFMAGAGVTAVEKYTDFRINAGVRYYIPQPSLYVGTSLQLKGSKKGEKTENGFGLLVEGGYVHFLTQNVTIEPSLYYDLDFANSSLSGAGIKVGLGLYF